MTQEPIIDYPKNESGSGSKLVLRDARLARLRPKLDAPPATQPGSVDWTVTRMFGSVDDGVRYIESLVAGQGDQAHDRWVNFCLLYREWEAKFHDGLLPTKPTLNQVCHSLDFDARQFLGELQVGMQSVMVKMGAIRAAMAIPEVVNKSIEVALSDEGDTKDRELALRLGGMIQDKTGVQVNVQQNNTNNNVLKSDRDRMKNPLLQFSQTVEAIDNDAREAIDAEVIDG